nr:hypothetical protein [Tanacetum cinerariifolium]
MITPFHDDPYMIVRQAYTSIATNIESEPLEDPIEIEETQLLCLDEDSEPMKVSKTRTASPSDIETKGDESKAEGIGSERDESEDEGPSSEGKEAAPEGQQQ